MQNAELTSSRGVEPSAALSSAQSERWTRLISSVRVVGLCTLLSRVLGLARDVAMASLFGGGTVMDAFSVAFRVPNLARRLFGEGALTAAFLPVFVRVRSQEGAARSWQLASAVLFWLAVVLAGLVLVGEGLLLGLAAWCELGPANRLLVGLTAVMLPYLLLICLSAQISAVLHALGHFAWPALLPVLLNLVWLAGVCGAAVLWPLPEQQAHAVAVCVLAAGVLQVAAPWPALHRAGFRFDWAWQAVRGHVAGIIGTMLPVMIGLSVAQFNSMTDSLIAWGFARPPEAPAAMHGFGGLAYPLEVGTASALYFGQRLYQFPLGVLGVALGTVLFPQLSQHAALGRLELLRRDLTLGLRLNMAVGVPASAGLVLLAEPLTALLFRHGAFDAEDVRQTTGMVIAYGLGVWAHCGQLVINRGYYAVGDHRTPLRLGLGSVVLNPVLSLSLIWPLGGAGLAYGTTVCGVLQFLATAYLIERRIGPLERRHLAASALRTLAATAVMAAVGWCVLGWLPDVGTLGGRSARVLWPLAASAAAFFAAARLLRHRDAWLLFTRSVGKEQSPRSGCA